VRRAAEPEASEPERCGHGCPGGGDGGVGGGQAGAQRGEQPRRCLARRQVSFRPRVPRPLLVPLRSPLPRDPPVLRRRGLWPCVST
jgi:hypothetical protein